MSTYVVGDIQGCYRPLQNLLKKVKFVPSRDKLWCVGDLVNRGPRSLETLRFLREIDESVKIVLGNHDLHFIAIHEGCAPDKTKDTLAKHLGTAVYRRKEACAVSRRTSRNRDREIADARISLAHERRISAEFASKARMEIRDLRRSGIEARNSGQRHAVRADTATKAVEMIDRGLEQICQSVLQCGGEILITADHGNCELMRDPETGGPHTAHTTNPVPLVLVGGSEGQTLSNGRLADLAPTLLYMMGVDQPVEMTGRNLIADAGDKSQSAT